MKKQDIDKIFKMIEEKPEEILKMANDEKLISKVIEANGDYSEELIKQCCSNILDQIKDNELYEYFEKTGLSTDENKEIFVGLLTNTELTPEKVNNYIEKFDVYDQCTLVAATHNVEYIKKYINENNEKINSYQKIELIKATNDKEYMKSLIASENLENYDKIEIIEEINDVEYTKECIANEKLHLDNTCKTALIASTKDKEYIKSFVGNEDIDSYDKAVLIISANDVEYTKECIKELKLNSECKAKLIVSTNDEEYMKLCVENESIRISDKIEIIKKINDVEYTKECIGNEKLGLDSNSKIELIISTNDKEYIKECISNRKLGLDNNSKIELIASTNDKEYTKECISNGKLGLDNKSKVKLIALTNDVEYTKECIGNEKLGLDSNGKIELIISTNDKEYIKECISNRKLGLDNNSKIELIASTNDKEYTKECISNGKLGLDNKSKVRLIAKMNDVEYTKECIENEKLGFDKKEKFQLALLTEDEEYIDKSLNLNNDIKKINLPDNMTIGVEIEAEGIEKVQYKNMFSNWKAKGDGSLKDGIEVVSPVLSGSNEDSKNIYKACYMLENLGCSTSERCGGHVHIGADFLKDKQAYLNLLEIFGDSEEILYTISNNAGEITRMGGASHYAVPISKKIENALESGKIDLKNSEDISKFASEIKEVQGDRYSGINFMNVGEGGKNTVEFRLANGTINPETWIENINLFGGVIVSAQSISKIQAKNEQDRTEQEKSDLEKFEMLKDKTINNEERLDMLLDLTVSKEDKEIYQNRYKENSKLLEKNDIVSKSIKGQISEETLNFEDKKKKLFEDAIDVTKESVTTKDIERQDKNIEDIIRENSIEHENNAR